MYMCVCVCVYVHMRMYETVFVFCSTYSGTCTTYCNYINVHHMNAHVCLCVYLQYQDHVGTHVGMIILFLDIEKSLSFSSHSLSLRNN